MNTSSINESLGIQERTNKEYHDSLLKISRQIKDIFTELYTNKRQTDVLLYQREYPEGSANPGSVTHAASLTAEIKSVDWIDKATFLVTPVPPGSFDAMLIGDSEYAAYAYQDEDNRLTFEYQTVITFYRDNIKQKEVTMPLKIKDAKITECYISVFVSEDVSPELIETALDHELGHAKDVLDRHIEYKDLNADKTDFDYLYDTQFEKYNEQEVPANINDASSVEHIKQYLQKCAPETINKWFIMVASYDLNASEIIQHRKNFYFDAKEYIKNPEKYPTLNQGHSQFESLEDKMKRFSEDYQKYSQISLILHSILDYLPDEKKIDFAQFTIKMFASRDRGDSRKRFMYGKDFADRNGKYSVKSFDEFIKYHIKNVDEYFLKRCSKLFRQMLHENSFSKFSLKESLRSTHILIKRAEEELLCD